MTSGYLERPCNKCVLEGIQVLADARDAEVIEVPSPTPDAPHGVRVLVLYPGDMMATPIAWLASIPERCTCGG